MKVRIEPSGHEFESALGETILEAALREGFRLPYSCRNGACGTCKGRVLEGQVTMRAYEPKALSEADRAAGKVLFCRAEPQTPVVIEAREIGAAKDIIIQTLPARVVRRERLCHDVMLLSLKLPQNARLQYLAGQYIDILLKDGRRRGFSLANAPEDDALLDLHIRHVPGGLFSGYVFESMQERALLRFEGPLGTFFLREDSSRPVILVAGGTGFAPMKAILEHAFSAQSPRPLHLYWGVRAAADLYLADLPRQWQEAHANFQYTPVLSEPAPEEPWEGRTGFVHTAVLQDYPDLGDYEVYASGPPPMIESIKEEFIRAGLPEAFLYYDAFEPAKDPT